MTTLMTEQEIDQIADELIQTCENNSVGLFEKESRGSELCQLVTFVLGQEEFAVDISSVREINRMLQITSVPQAPECVHGIINLRGRIIPVIDLSKVFNWPPVQLNQNSRIIVVEVRGRTLGFTVDRVNEVMRLDRSLIEPAPDMGNQIDRAYVEGVGKMNDRLVILLNLGVLFSSDIFTHFPQQTL